MVSTAPKGKVRLITFQGKEVLEELASNKVYYADDTRKRENRDYSRDRDNIGGHQPVWCFRVPEPIQLDRWYTGAYLFNYSCEMSLNNKSLKDFKMLELLVDEDLPVTGVTHNSYEHSVVLPYLKEDWVTMHYELKERFLVDAIGSLVGLWIIRHSSYLNLEYNSLSPLFEDNFHILAMEEYDEVKSTVSTDLPLKSYSRVGHVKNELVHDYRGGVVTKYEFLRKAGIQVKGM